MKHKPPDGRKTVTATHVPLRVSSGGRGIPRIGLVYNLKRSTPSDPEYEQEAEFDSPKTIEGIRGEIAMLGYAVVLVEATRDVAEHLKAAHIDIVFNVAEGVGKRTREAQVPALCDLLGIEHTGSDATCLALTLDKELTKKVMHADGIPTPRYRLYEGGRCAVSTPLRFPVIVKPNHEGTSKGIGAQSVIMEEEELAGAVAVLWEKFYQPILCEEYIEGRELTVGVLGGDDLRVLGPMEIVFKEEAGEHPVYSFEAKQSVPNPLCDFVCPVPLDRAVREQIEHLAVRAFRSVGCRDVARLDFRMSASGEVYLLEVNPLPGLMPGFSDLCVMAQRGGISYGELIQCILEPAVRRWRFTKTCVA